MMNMNAMATMLNAKPQVSSPSNQAVDKPKAGGSDFMASLKQAMTSGDQDAIKSALAKLETVNPEKIDLSELKHLMGELMELFTELLELLPEDFSEVDETFISSFLDEWEGVLPDEWLSDLNDLTAMTIPFADLLTFSAEGESKSDDEPDPIQLLLMMAFLDQESMEDVSSMSAEVAGYFNHAEGLLASLTQLMLPDVKPDQQINVNQMKQKWALMFERMAKTPEPVAQQNSQQSRFQEFAFLKELYTRTSSNSNSTQQGPSLLLDTNNAQLARFQMMMGSSLTQQAQPERANQDAFIKQFQNMLSRGSFQQLSNGIQQMTIKLHPQSLGRLDIQVQMVNGSLVARMVTSSHAARELLDGQLQSLRTAFQSQNIQVDRLEVTQQQTNSLFKEPEKEKENQEQMKQDQDFEEDQDDEEVLDFSALLEVSIDEEV
ncbi:flagellar hook-length control protein FliK [Salisediminibacterium beveridgei]|uniref:Flagellar hook-length control protein FliK n=1 Tax=Salisediminibacterium beveridgei TaxID=632773 RepID=A0A1D7QVZ5_9BACI|nr:flagellar hook-length control protein FliK [Salisediminibacterium beveridgei]AOM83184.1 Flagellar hook-length control protein FliK [Salisediminibacterium beveridgei]